MSVRYISYKFDTADADKSARQLAYIFDPSWKNSEGDVEVVQFTDGITNTLSKARKKWPGRSDAENDEDSILMRSYGQGTDVLIDREREMKAHNLLTSMGLAPPLLARFDNGLLYRFLPGHVCSAEDLRRPQVYRQVAKLLGQWHGSLPISAITSTPDLEQEAYRLHCGMKDGKQTRPLPNIFSMMHHWIGALSGETQEEKDRNHMLNVELAELSARFGETPGLAGKDYIFSHCDLLCGNVIVKQPPGDYDPSKELPVSFIDYEYSTPGPAAFDIANHFAEFAGYDCEHGFVPTKSQRREFIQYYVSSFRYHSIALEDSMSIDIDLKEDVEQLYRQVDEFRGLPGFFWGIWALIQSMISQIDFDYVTYADGRFSEYWAWKGEMDGSRDQAGKEMPLRERRWAEE